MPKTKPITNAKNRTMKTVSTTLDERMRDGLRAAADQEQRTVSQVIRTSVTKYLSDLGYV